MQQGIEEIGRLYLDLLKKALTRSLSDEYYESVKAPLDARWRPAFLPIERFLARYNLAIVRRRSADSNPRLEGEDWPADAETMIGIRRLDNLEDSIRTIIADDLQGDLLEAGVWRGGASIFMRAVLKVLDDETRRIWLADSFRGLPRPDPRTYPADATDRHWASPQLAASEAEVRKNFARYGLLDEQVVFLSGWFSETLSGAPVDRISLLRLDGDMYESTIVALKALYPKVVPKGFVIIDDYWTSDTCRAAVDDYCKKEGITPQIEQIDRAAVFWRKELS
jgi:O-methyltransferase